MRIAVRPGSCLSSELSNLVEEKFARSIVVSDRSFDQGGQGSIYEVREIDGKRSSGLLVKAFQNGILPPNVKDIMSEVRTRNSDVQRCKALQALPLFSFEGVTAAGPFCGYVMRQVPGKTFHQILEADLARYINLPIDARLRFCLQFVEGMSLLYSLTIVHADLNGQNLMLDFGTKRLSIIDLDGGVVARNGSTPAVMGKPDPGWLAPEIVAQLSRSTMRRAVDVTITADIWSIACGVHHLLFGLSPFFFIAEHPDIQRYLDSYSWPQVRGINGLRTRNANAFDYYERSFSKVPQLRDLFRVSFQDGYTDVSRRTGAYQWMQAIGAMLQIPTPRQTRVTPSTSVTIPSGSVGAQLQPMLPGSSAPRPSATGTPRKSAPAIPLSKVTARARHRPTRWFIIVISLLAMAAFLIFQVNSPPNRRSLAVDSHLLVLSASLSQQARRQNFESGVVHLELSSYGDRVLRIRADTGGHRVVMQLRSGLIYANEPNLERSHPVIATSNRTSLVSPSIDWTIVPGAYSVVFMHNPVADGCNQPRIPVGLRAWVDDDQ